MVYAWARARAVRGVRACVRDSGHAQAHRCVSAYVCVCACVCAVMRACVRARAQARVRVRARVGADRGRPERGRTSMAMGTTSPSILRRLSTPLACTCACEAGRKACSTAR
eukprot:1419828-Pleurochrysis_carterae.AAC.1